MSAPESDPVEPDEDETAAEEDGDVTEPDEPETSNAPTEALAAVEDEQSSFEEMERMGKSLDALQRHVSKRITEILGDLAPEWEECELCNYWNTPGWRHKGPLPEAVEDALRVALGGHGIAEFKPDEFSRACEKCNGLGFVLTGSKVTGQE